MFYLILLSNFFYRPLFRSYKPVDESLQDLVQPEPEIGEITDKVADELKNENEGVVMDNLVSKQNKPENCLCPHKRIYWT